MQADHVLCVWVCVQGIEREYQELDTVWFMAGSLFKNYPYDIPTEAFSLALFTQAFATVQASIVHLQDVTLSKRFALVPLGPPLLSYSSTSKVICLLLAFFFFFFWGTGEMSTLRQATKVPNEPSLRQNNDLENVSLSDQSMAYNPRKGQAGCLGLALVFLTSLVSFSASLCVLVVFFGSCPHNIRSRSMYMYI